MEYLLKLDGRASAGGSPLVFHNERLADPLDDMTRALAAVTKKRGKTEVDHLEVARLEFYGGLYTEPRIASPADLNGQVVIIPSINILRCLQDGAKRHKRGVDVLRGVFPQGEGASLTYDGPANPEALWKEGYWLRKTVSVQRSRTVRTRPMFTDWQAELLVEVDPTVFDLDTLRTLWREAGIYAGLCEMRPIYGRFAGTITKAKAKA